MDTHELRTAALAVYSAVQKEVADDLSKKLEWAADKIDSLETPLADPKAVIIDDDMPFTHHSASHLWAILKSIVESPLPIEVFDAFLSEYANGKNLDEARSFAQSEWDC